MVDTEDRVDKLLREKTGISTSLEQIRENIKFVDRVQNDPVTTEVFNEQISEFEVININPYIEQQALPNSIYDMDKLIRLNTKASMEWQKRYLSKKRTVPMKMIWIIILLAVVIVVVMLFIMFVLPQLGAVGHGGLM